jgi:ABC-type uncharacterized transport system permease subunit
MTGDLHALAAAIYLVAAVLATLGLAARHARLARGAVLALAAGAVAHAAAFFQDHDFHVPPRATGLPGAVSLAAFLCAVFFLALARRPRLRGLAALVAPAAFLGAFYAAVALDPAAARATPPWAQAHVLLASAGLALLAVAGFAGALFLAHHRSLKRKRAPEGRLALPPLEALDRVNALAVSVGFLLLSLALVTGVVTGHEREGRLFTASPHAAAALFAWAIYAALLAARFLARQGAARSALSAVAGFAVLVIAVLGAGMLR